MYINKKSKIVVSALLLATLASCSDSKSSAEYIAEAKVSFQNGENSTAIIALKNVLKTDENNLEARFLLGAVYAQQGLWLNAEKELRRAKNSGFNERDIDTLLVKVAYRLDDTEYLSITKNVKNEYSDLANLYLAILTLKNGNVEDGRAIFDEIILVNNDPSISKFALAWDLFLNAKYSASLEQLTLLESSNVLKEDIIELRVVNKVAQKKYESAAEQLELFLKLHPQSHTHRLQLAEQYVKYRNYEQAEKNADILLSYYKHNVILNRIKAEIKFNAKEYTLAKEFSEVSLRNSEDVLSKVIAGLSAYQLGQYESAFNYLNAISRFFPERHAVNQVLNSLSDQLANSSVSNDPLLSDVVLSLIQAGSYKKARTALEKSAESSQLNDGVIDFRLGLLKVIEGDSSFTDDFERAISNGFDGVEPKVLLAQQYLKDKEYSKVLEISESLMPTQQTTALLLKGSVYLDKNELDEAISVYESILSNEPEHMGTLFKLSEAFYKANELEKSIGYLKKIYALSSSNFYAVKHLFKISLTASYKDNLEQFFISQVEEDKKNVNRHIVLTEFYMLHNELEEALKISSRFLLKLPDQKEMLLLKTKTLLSLKRVNDAKNSLALLEKVAPLDPDVIKNKALVLNIEGNNVEAIKVIESYSGENNGILNDDLLIMLSTLYLANKQVPEAEQTLIQVKDKKSIRYVRIEGKMALMKGDNNLAIRSLSKVFNETPSEIIGLELVQALQNEKKYEKAIQVLEPFLLKAEPGQLLLMKYKLTELCEVECPKKAEHYYKELLVETNNNVATLNNIAWFYYTQQRFSEGKKYASQAVKQAPKLAAVQNTLGVILLELDELKQANRHFQLSVSLEPNNDKYKIWLAKGLILSDDAKAAELIKKEINVETLKPKVKSLFNEVFKQ